MSWAIPVPAAGRYQVRLHFAETWFGATSGAAGGNGLRVFTLTLEQGAVVVPNIAVFKEAGGAMTALVKEYAVPVNDGTLDLQLSATVNRPIISGIEVVYVGPTGP